MSTDAFSFSIGTLDCWALADEQFNYPAEAFFCQRLPRRAHGRIRSVRGLGPAGNDPYTCLYLETGDEQVLIAASAGPGSAHATGIFPDVDHTTTSTGHLPENLRAICTAPSAIDTVILTHAHPDHVGGTSMRTGSSCTVGAVDGSSSSRISSR